MKHLWTRSVPVEPASYDRDKRSVRVTIATEQPVVVWDWDRWEAVRETLLMSGMQTPANGQTPLLDSHDRSSIFSQLGSLRDFQIEGDRCSASCYFDSTEEGKKAELKVVEGHLTDISAGYRQVETYYVPAGEKQIIEGREYEGPIRVTTKWQLLEGSLTPIGADDRSKVRADALPDNVRAVLIKRGLKQDATDAEALDFIEKYIRTDNAGEGARQESTPQPIIKEESTMPNDKPTPEEQERLERERVATIEEIAVKFGERIEGGKSAMERKKKDAIELGIPVEQFRGQVFLSIRDTEPIETPTTYLGLSEREVQRYSVRRAAISLLRKRGLGGFAKGVDTGFEDECTAALIGRVENYKGGMILPFEVERKPIIPMTGRDMTVGTPTAGGNLVGTNLVGFIDFMRNVPIAARAGVNQLYGLTGNLAIPRQTGDPTFYWRSEANPPAAESQPSIGQLVLSPKTGSAYTDFSRELLVQSSPSVDGIIMRSLANVAIIGIDKATLHGTGGTQPTGIANTASIGSVDLTNPFSRAHALEFESDVRSSNAESASMKFIMNPADVAILKARPEQLNYPKYIVSDDERILNYPVLWSNQSNSGYVFFGGFSQAVLCYWGGIELALDDKTQLTSGIFRLVAFVMVDFGVFQPGAFSVGSGLN